LFFSLLRVGEPLVQRVRLHVVAGQLRMGQRFVNEEELDALGTVIAINRLQTGDVPKKRRSGQTAKSQHRVMSPQAGCFHFLSV
jgi:hypothetical protein